MFGEDKNLTKESEVDLSHLHSCQQSLLPDVYRVNHQIVSYKRANVFIVGKEKPNNENQVSLINEKEFWSQFGQVD